MELHPTHRAETPLHTLMAVSLSQTKHCSFQTVIPAVIPVNILEPLYPHLKNVTDQLQNTEDQIKSTHFLRKPNPLILRKGV